MNTFLNSPAFVIAFTFVVYYAAQQLEKRTQKVILNPILVSIIVIIAALNVMGISYTSYHEGCQMIEFLLKPAVVAMGVPLYHQLEKIKKQTLSILVSQAVGCIVSIVSVVIIAKYLGAPKEVILSLAPKSVTTPIAIEVSRSIGGIPALTASVVIFVGIFGSIFGYAIMHRTWVKNPVSQGLSMGTAAHAVGTSRSMEISPRFGAFSSLGLIVNGILTALLAPYIVQIVDKLIDI
ncbi:MAG: LrgB family protein [Niabella sp.]